jgi:uncharacterized protein
VSENDTPESPPVDPDIDAFDTVCRRLAGFDERIDTEWADGYLTAIAAGPRAIPPDEWLPAMCGDAFERAFADPADHTQALRSLKARLSVLLDQLDPEALLDDPDSLRLFPLMSEITAEHRQRLVDELGLSVEDAALIDTGGLWAQGFLDAIEAHADIWVEPADQELAETFGGAVDQIAALLLPADSDEYAAHLTTFHPGEPPPRDDLIDEALFAVQLLRIYWLDNAPKPTTRRVEATPGRNDPCPCGSGKKFKKCHGAG